MPRKVFTRVQLKAEVNRQVDAQRKELIDLSLKIHGSPELGFKEEKASNWLVTHLAKGSFKVEKGVGGLHTAFKAVYGSGKPMIALIAEYDALPEIGHGCGHNIIAASSVGAAIASRRVVDSYGGTIAVFGTPAEELFGGKVLMLNAGVFDGVDVAMMVHPGLFNAIATAALACIALEIEFFGKAAHAAACPEEGINALDAMIQAFNAVNSLRQHMKSNARVHGIITRGGEAANVVPAYSAATFLVRAADSEYLDELKQKVLNCFMGASLATGARLEYKWSDIVYAPMKNNMVLGELFAQNLTSLGRKVEPREPHFGSTDMANISQVIPTIHPFIAIASPDVSFHSVDFAQAAASETGHKGMLDAAKALAMTVVDLLTDPEALTRVKEEFFSTGNCRKVIVGD